MLARRNLTRAAHGMTYLGDELREVGRDHRHKDVNAGRGRSPPGEAIKVGIEQRDVQNAARATDRRKIQSIHRVHEERREHPRCSRRVYCNYLSSSSHVSCMARSVSIRLFFVYTHMLPLDLFDAVATKVWVLCVYAIFRGKVPFYVRCRTQTPQAF